MDLCCMWIRCVPPRSAGGRRQPFHFLAVCSSAQAPGAGSVRLNQREKTHASRFCPPTMSVWRNNLSIRREHWMNLTVVLRSGGERWFWNKFSSIISFTFVINAIIMQFLSCFPAFHTIHLNEVKKWGLNREGKGWSPEIRSQLCL